MRIEADASRGGRPGSTRSLTDRALGTWPLGNPSEGRVWRLHLRRRIQLWAWYRIPRWVRTTVGRLVFPVGELAFRLAGCRRPGGEIRTILVIRLDHIGDFLMSTPAIRALRRAYPAAEIIGVVGSWARPVAQANPHLDRLATYDAIWFRRRSAGISVAWKNLRTRLWLIGLRTDLAVNLRGDYGNVLFTYLTGARLRAGHLDAPDGGARCRHWLTHPVAYRACVHEIERCLDVVAAVGAAADGTQLEFPISPPAQEQADRLLGSLGWVPEAPLVVIHPGGGWPLNWWPADRFAALADWLTEARGAAVLLVGGQDERELVNHIRRMTHHPIASLCGQTTLEVLGALLQRAALFVGNDGGPMHLAEAMDIPLVALFGCSPAALIGPRSRRVQVVQGPAPTPHCPQFEWGVTVRCPDRLCMRGVPLAQVQAAVDSLLAGRERVGTHQAMGAIA